MRMPATPLDPSTRRRERDPQRLRNAIEISRTQLDRCRHMMLPRAAQAGATPERLYKIVRGLSSRSDAWRSTVTVLDGPRLG